MCAYLMVCLHNVSFNPFVAPVPDIYFIKIQMKDIVGQSKANDSGLVLVPLGEKKRSSAVDRFPGIKRLLQDSLFLWCLYLQPRNYQNFPL